MSKDCVCVAVRVRPLLPKEVLHHHEVCLRVVPGTARVMVGSDRSFSFDHAFGPTATQRDVYEACIKPRVESLVEGFNATVFCYGQTGAGKTYTLGGGKLGGITDSVAQDVFTLLQGKRKSNIGLEATVRVSYLELYMEELRDLLEPHTVQKALHIRQDKRGNTVVVGAKQMVVTSAEELLSVVEMGNSLRHNGATLMNEHSSRSHAILTLQLTQHCLKSSPNGEAHYSKLCLVDLGGSERAGKTGNRGSQLKESAHINTGLLALGNVIRALSNPDRNRRKDNGAHIPYRGAKITRLLRDSLGGTAHTLMVACVSPSHHSIAESLSVLHFASKARHVRNQPQACQTEAKSYAAAWDPRDARLGELEYEVQTLRELLNGKERRMEKREKTQGRVGGGDGLNLGSPTPDKEENQRESSQYCMLVQEAAALLAETSDSTQNQAFKQRLLDWQERLRTVDLSHQTNNQNCSDKKDQVQHETILQLKQELKKYKEALNKDEELLEHKDAKLKQMGGAVKKLLREREKHLQALEDEKERTRMQTEQLVNQQMLIDSLRGDLLTLLGKTTGAKTEKGASWNSDKMLTSDSSIRCSCGQLLSGRPPSGLQSYSLERLMAFFKVRGLLQPENVNKDEVYCPFTRQLSKGKDHGREDDHSFLRKMELRCSSSNPWTVTQKKSMAEQVIIDPDRASDGMYQPNGKESLAEGSDEDVLGKLSAGNWMSQTEPFDSLKLITLQRMSLQKSLLSSGDTSSNISDFFHDRTADSCWLEDTEERVPRRGVERKDLAQELRRREDTLQQEKDTVEQKNKLENKRAMSQDPLQLSVRLEAELQDGGIEGRQAVRVTRMELKRERDALRRKRDTLDVQDNRVLTVEEEHSLIRLEEAIEVLDAALDFENQSIQGKLKPLSGTDSDSCRSPNLSETTELYSVIRKLRELSGPEASELLVKYFNKVVCLREMQRHLRLRCEALELQAREQQVALREMEAAVQRLSDLHLEDIRLIQLQQDNQNNMQLLLQKLQEGNSEDKQMAVQDRLTYLERELVFYKTSSRQLKKKLKQLLGDTADRADQPPRSRSKNGRGAGYCGRMGDDSSVSLPQSCETDLSSSSTSMWLCHQ